MFKVSDRFLRSRISIKTPHSFKTFMKTSGASHNSSHLSGSFLKMIYFRSLTLCAVFLTACQLQDKSVKALEVQMSPGKYTKASQECQMTPVIHVLTHAGCKPKAIPSFACLGKCSSYVQVSGSKIWQMERTCNCCQESGEREATVILYCPDAKNEEKRFRKVSTKAPLECMCRPCGSIEESAIIPQEIAGFAEEGPLHKQFRKSLSSL